PASRRASRPPSAAPARAPCALPAGQTGLCCPRPALRFPRPAASRPVAAAPLPPPRRRSDRPAPPLASACLFPFLRRRELPVDQVLLPHGQQVRDNPIQHQARGKLRADV